MKQPPFHHNVSLVPSAFLVEDFAQSKVFGYVPITNVFAWISTDFCSFDNWLCNPISENWQLTLSG